VNDLKWNLTLSPKTVENGPNETFQHIPILVSFSPSQFGVSLPSIGK
jgi:hypothetical protein